MDKEKKKKDKDADKDGEKEKRKEKDKAKQKHKDRKKNKHGDDALDIGGKSTLFHFEKKILINFFLLLHAQKKNQFLVSVLI